jgi:hypothetical protein
MTFLDKIFFVVCLAAGAAPLAGCNVESTFKGTGGVSLDGGAKDGGQAGVSRGVVVVNTDYSGSSVVSLLSNSGEVTSPAFIGSGSVAPGLSAAFSGDVVVPTMRLPGSEIVLIDRKVSVLSWVNLATSEVRAQLPVRTGFLSNPHDYVPYSATKAFVTRYEPNLDPGKEPFDLGNDVLVVDPEAAEIIGSIDLMSALGGAPAGFYPRADRALIAGGKLRVTANAMNADFTRNIDSRVVTVDPESGAMEHVFVTEGLHNCSGIALSPDGSRLAVTCSGRFGEDPSEGFPRSGVVILAVGDELTEVQRFTAKEWGTEQITGAEWTSASTLLVSTAGRFAAEVVPDTLRLLDLDSGVLEKPPVVQSNKDAFVLGGAQCDLPSKTCFVPDAGTDRGVLHQLSIESGGAVTVERAIKIDTGTGLPPRYLGAF